MSARIFKILRNHFWALCLGMVLLFLAFPKLPLAFRWPARIGLLVLALMLLLSFALKLQGIVRQPRKALSTLLALLLGATLSYGVAESLCWAYLRTRPALIASPFTLSAQQRKSIEDMISGGTGYLAYSPTLGWTVRKNGVSPDGLYHANAAGFRALREYTGKKPPGVVRALCFGDSFTHCEEVGDEDTWELHAERSQPGLECLNFGVPGFGVTQAYVRYREATPDFEADFVFIGCMTDDIRRSVNPWYPLSQVNPHDAPSAVALPFAGLDASGALKVNPPVLADLGAYRRLLADPGPVLRTMAGLHILYTPRPSTPLLTVLDDRLDSDSFRSVRAAAANSVSRAWSKIANSQHPAAHRMVVAQSPVFSPGGPVFEINCKLFAQFIADVKRSGAVPIVLWFPSADDFKRQADGREPIYTAFLQYFAANHETCLNVLDWLLEEHPRDKPLPANTIFTGGHFSPETNRMIGRRLAAFLTTLQRAGGTRPRPEQ